MLEAPTYSMTSRRLASQEVEAIALPNVPAQASQITGPLDNMAPLSVRQSTRKASDASPAAALQAAFLLSAGRQLADLHPGLACQYGRSALKVSA